MSLTRSRFYAPVLELLQEKAPQPMLVSEIINAIIVKYPENRNQWVDSSGNPVTSEVFTGNEKGIKVELTGIPDNVTPVPVAGYALEEDKDHVNRFRVTDYPDTQEAPERITEKAKDKDYTTNMYDVVTLEKNTDKFNGYTLEYILNGYRR